MGINSDTPLGYTVSIRSEKDHKKIKQMTKKEKQIRTDWLNFRNKQKKSERVYIKGKELTNMLSKMFR